MPPVWRRHFWSAGTTEGRDRLPVIWHQIGAAVFGLLDEANLPFKPAVDLGIIRRFLALAFSLIQETHHEL